MKDSKEKGHYRSCAFQKKFRKPITERQIAVPAEEVFADLAPHHGAAAGLLYGHAARWAQLDTWRLRVGVGDHEGVVLAADLSRVPGTVAEAAELRETGGARHGRALADPGPGKLRLGVAGADLANSLAAGRGTPGPAGVQPNLLVQLGGSVLDQQGGAHQALQLGLVQYSLFERVSIKS